MNSVPLYCLLAPVRTGYRVPHQMPRRATLLVLLAVAAMPACGDAQQTLTVTSNGLAAVALCAPMARVDSSFTGARDTLVVGEDGETRWPSKVVGLGPARWALFESSWVDTAHVWRFSTNSPDARTPRGYHPGMEVGVLVQQGEELGFNIAEGVLVVRVRSEGVAFVVDDSSSAVFFRQPGYRRDPRSALSPHARIKQLIVSGSCPH